MKTQKIAYLLAGELWFCLGEDAAVRTTPLAEYTHIAFSVSKDHFLEVTQKIQLSGVSLWKQNQSEGDSLYFLDPNGHKLEIHVGDWRSRIADTKKHPWEKNIQFFNKVTTSHFKYQTGGRRWISESLLQSFPEESSAKFLGI